MQGKGIEKFRRWDIPAGCQKITKYNFKKIVDDMIVTQIIESTQKDSFTYDLTNPNLTRDDIRDIINYLHAAREFPYITGSGASSQKLIPEGNGDRIKVRCPKSNKIYSLEFFNNDNDSWMYFMYIPLDSSQIVYLRVPSENAAFFSRIDITNALATQNYYIG